MKTRESSEGLSKGAGSLMRIVPGLCVVNHGTDGMVWGQVFAESIRTT